MLHSQVPEYAEYAVFAVFFFPAMGWRHGLLLGRGDDGAGGNQNILAFSAVTRVVVVVWWRTDQLLYTLKALDREASPTRDREHMVLADLTSYCIDDDRSIPA